MQTQTIERREVEALRNRAKQLILTQAWLGKTEGLRFAQGSFSALQSLLDSDGESYLADRDDSLGGYQPLAGFEAAWASFPIGAKNLSLSEVQEFLALQGVELSADAVTNMQVNSGADLKGREVAPFDLHDEHGLTRADLDDGSSLHGVSSVETSIVKAAA